MISMFAFPELFSEFIKHTPLSSSEKIFIIPFYVNGVKKFSIIDDSDVGIFLIDDNDRVSFFFDNEFIRGYGNISYEDSRLSVTELLFKRIIWNISPDYVFQEPKKEKILCKATERGDCLICLNKCSKNNCFKLQCACKYSCHKKCIEKWLDKNNKCPICSE